MQLRWRVLVTASFLVIGCLIFLSYEHNPEKIKEIQLARVPVSEKHHETSYNIIEDKYFQRLDGVHLKCNNMPHVGIEGDGGWEVCMTPAFRPKKPCLVYSFGVNNVWGFDEAMARDYGCFVRAFDPSMADKDHIHTPGPVHFYRIGLAGSNRKLGGWKLYTFQTLLDRFGESNHTLDLVKIDIEYSEWEAFESMLKTGVLQRTKQLLFETHTREVSSGITTEEDYKRYNKILDAIEGLGFRRFFRHENHYGINAMAATRSKTLNPSLRRSVAMKRTCCHEVYYVNMKYAYDQSGLTFHKAD